MAKYKNVDDLVTEMQTELKLPLTVIGKVEISRRRQNGDYFVNLQNVHDNQGNSIKFSEQEIKRIFIDKSTKNETLETEYNKYAGEFVKAKIDITDNHGEKELARERDDYSKLLKVQKDSITIVSLISAYDNETQELIEFFREEVQDLKDLKDLKEEITQKKDEKNKLGKEYDNLIVRSSTYNINQNLIIENLKQQTKKLEEEYEAKLATLKKYFPSITATTQNTVNKTDDIITQEHEKYEEFKKDLLSYLHYFILNQGLRFSKETIKTFFALVKSHDFVVLAGQSGTGKTSLVKEFAKAVNGKAFVIPVKPNWSCKEDLLGYYNPIQSQYISTEFLDALIEAENHPDTPYFICLDEMNLAHVEYYFADFLSKLEDRKPDIEISLYSTELYPDNIRLADILNNTNSADINEDNISEYTELIDFIKLHYRISKNLTNAEYFEHFKKIMPKIPPKVTIGNNVHFFGTANVDETTHYFSPKVLDRVQVLKFDSPFAKNQSNHLNAQWQKYQIDFEKLCNPILLTAEEFGCRGDYPAVSDSSGKDIKEYIENIAHDLENIGISIGWRMLRQAINYKICLNEINEKYVSQEECVSQQDISQQTKDDFMIHKIFPRLRIHTEKDFKNVKKIIEEKDFLEKLGNDSKTKKEFERLKKIFNNKKIYNYWG